MREKINAVQEPIRTWFSTSAKIEPIVHYSSVKSEFTANFKRKKLNKLVIIDVMRREHSVYLLHVISGTLG